MYTFSFYLFFWLPCRQKAGGASRSVLEIVHLESLKRKQSAEGEATGGWGGGVTEVSRGGEEVRRDNARRDVERRGGGRDDARAHPCTDVCPSRVSACEYYSHLSALSAPSAAITALITVSA